MGSKGAFYLSETLQHAFNHIRHLERKCGISDPIGLPAVLMFEVDELQFDSLYSHSISSSLEEAQLQIFASRHADEEPLDNGLANDKMKLIRHIKRFGLGVTGDNPTFRQLHRSLRVAIEAKVSLLNRESWTFSWMSKGSIVDVDKIKFHVDDVEPVIVI